MCSPAWRPVGSPRSKSRASTRPGSRSRTWRSPSRRWSAPTSLTCQPSTSRRVASATRTDRQHALGEPPPAAADTVLLHQRRAGVPGSQRLTRVAERLQEVSQVEEADANVPLDVAWIAAVGEGPLHIKPRPRHDLENAPRAGGRGEVGLVAGLHPGERTGESTVDTVMA